MRNTSQRLALVVTVLCSWAGPALAAGSGMPWEGPVQQILESLTGPVAQAAGILAIVFTGLAFAFSEAGSVLRRWIGITFGLAIAFAAGSFGVSFFGFSGGAGF